MSSYSLVLYVLVNWAISAHEVEQECAPFFPGSDEASLTNIPRVVNAYEVPYCIN